jgi:pimeloyl-ACP methyl ester carboxylesterase
MWEGLARTPRQDKVLHGAAKLANVLIGLVLLPLYLLGQSVGGRVRDFLVGLERRSRRMLPVPAPGPRHMDSLLAEFQGLEHHLRQSPVAEVRRGLADISNFVVAQHREGAVIGYRYPAQFKDHMVVGADGERIAASIALQEAARPGLIVVHGVFTSSRFDYVRQIAVKAFYEWGFNVAALDLRSFGLSELTSPAPSTGGWKESLDILALADYMKELGSTSVGALGISLGGSSVVNASFRAGAEDALDGGIIAVSPPADPERAWERLSEPVPKTHPRYPIHRVFQAAFVSRIRSGRWPAEAEDMAKVMDVVGGPYYGISGAEIWHNARCVDHVAEAKVPLLVLHPEDDQIIKVEHAEMLRDAAAGNELVKVWILPAGAHGALEAIDSKFTYNVYRGFFERWGRYAERSDGAGGKSPEVVYSASHTG